jgi:hypothetical protein
MSDQIQTRELQNALEKAFGKSLLCLRRAPSVYSSSSTLEELELFFADGNRLLAMFKNLGSDGVLESSRGVRPQFLCNSQREIDVYRFLLQATDIGTARLYGYDLDRSWLFVEKVVAPELFQVGEFETWLEVARWLARFHASALSAPGTAGFLVPSLMQYDANYYLRWLERAGLRVPYANVLKTLLQLPATLIHGDFYASNILVGGGRICPVDWEMAAIGPGLLDVATLASGKWTREQRLAMAEAYCTAVPERLKPHDWVHAFDCCQLQIALQWLGWSEAWVPPGSHIHDWLDEALTLSRNFINAS